MTAPKNSGATQNKSLGTRRNTTKSYSNNKSSNRSSKKESSRQALKLARQRRGAAALVLPNKPKKIVRRYIPSKRHNTVRQSQSSSPMVGLPTSSSVPSLSSSSCEHKDTVIKSTLLDQKVALTLTYCAHCDKLLSHVATEVQGVSEKDQQVEEPVDQTPPTRTTSVIEPQNQAAEEWASMHHLHTTW